MLSNWMAHCKIVLGGAFLHPSAHPRALFALLPPSLPPSRPAPPSFDAPCKKGPSAAALLLLCPASGSPRPGRSCCSSAAPTSAGPAVFARAASSSQPGRQQTTTAEADQKLVSWKEQLKVQVCAHFSSFAPIFFSPAALKLKVDFFFFFFLQGPAMSRLICKSIW